MPRTHSFAGYKMEDMVMGNACTWNEFCICDSRRWPLRTLVLDASWHYDNFYVCKLYGFTLGASELDDAWPYKNYLLSDAKDFWKLVSSFVDVSIGLSLAAISTQSIAAILGQVWLFSKKLVSVINRLMMISGKKFNNVHGGVSITLCFLCVFGFPCFLFLGLFCLQSLDPFEILCLPRETCDDE